MTYTGVSEHQITTGVSDTGSGFQQNPTTQPSAVCLYGLAG